MVSARGLGFKANGLGFGFRLNVGELCVMSVYGRLSQHRKMTCNHGKESKNYYIVIGVI